jgi:ABC-type branched-subunit amino acid transport system permease subunit
LLGAAFVTALPHLVDLVVETGPGSAVTAAQLTQILFGLSIVAVVLLRARRSTHPNPTTVQSSM